MLQRIWLRKSVLIQPSTRLGKNEDLPYCEPHIPKRLVHLLRGLVHGGAWAIPEDETDAHVHGLHRALARARQLGERGASALDIVTETVAVLEARQRVGGRLLSSNGVDLGASWS